LCENDKFIKIRHKFYFLKPRLPIKVKKIAQVWASCLLVLFSLSGTCQKDTVAPYLAHFNKASELTDSAKYEEALVLLKKAIKLKPDLWEAHNKRAFILTKQKKYTEALKDLDKAEKIAPMNYESLKQRAITHFLNKQFPQSKAAMDTAVYLAQQDLLEDAELHYYRAQLMFAGKNYKSTIDACELVLEYKPGYLEAMVLKGEARFMQKEYNYAIRDLTEAIDKTSVEKTDYHAYQLRAKARFETGDYKGAVKDWNVFLESDPKNEEALISRAAAKINLNDNSGAIVDLDEAIKVNGKNAVSYCYRGVAKGGNRSYQEAMKDLDYSIKLKFDYPVAYVNRAAIRMALKNKRGACEDLQKAESLGSETAISLVQRYCK
jgi:tetratricopeptide (TPR) repeat protein